jgi:hypothetical protein
LVQDVLPKAIIGTGILTLAIAALGLQMLQGIIVYGIWAGFATALETFLFFTNYVYFPVILPIAALIIGVATLRNKKWTWKANIIFQSTSIAILLGSLTIPSILEPSGSYDFIAINRPLAVLLGFVVLILLFRPKTRAHYQAVVKAT